MISFDKDLRFSKNIEDKPSKIVRRLKRRKSMPLYFCLTAPTNPKNILDIVPATDFIYPVYKKRDIYVYGVAKGKDEAYALAMDMLLERYMQTGDFQVRKDG
jgi:hypothetical protein